MRYYRDKLTHMVHVAAVVDAPEHATTDCGIVVPIAGVGRTRAYWRDIITCPWCLRAGDGNQKEAGA